MSKIIWHNTRTATFYIVGFLNTILIRPEHIGTWRHFLGIFLLVLAVVETIVILRKTIEQRRIKGVK
jgi:hypothetical protein